MPLSKSGKKILLNIKKQYGSIKGKQVFYAWLNSKSEEERKKYEL